MLDTYFKQFFWTFNLAALAMCGYLVARAGNVFVADALLGEPTAVASGGRAKVEVDTNKSTVPTSAFLDRNLFGAEREDIVPEPEVDAAPERTTAPGEVDLDNCDKSSLRANLVATVVSSDDTRSVAVFVDPSKNRPESYRVGDPLLDSAEILAVQWRRVLVSNNGSCEFFSIDDDAPKKRKGRGEVAMSPPPPKKGGAPKMQKDQRHRVRDPPRRDRQRARQLERGGDASAHRPELSQRQGERLQALLDPPGEPLLQDRHPKR